MLAKGIMPAMVTPFLAEGNGVDVDAVRKLVNFHLSTGVSGFYLCGNTGEGLACTVDERKIMVETVMDELKKKNSQLSVIVMVAAKAVEDAMELARHAQSVGAHGISSTVPPDQPRQLDSAVAYWKQISSACTLPFYVYWIAATADKSVTVDKFLETVRLNVPTFAGFKFTDTNFYTFQQLMHKGGDAVNAVTGPDEMMVAGLAMGSHGAIGSTYNIHPKLAVRIFDAFHRGDVKEAMAAQVEMNRNIEVLIRMTRANERGTNIIAGIKAVYRRRYGIDVGVPRETVSIRLTQAEEDALMTELEGHVFE